MGDNKKDGQKTVARDEPLVAPMSRPQSVSMPIGTKKRQFLLAGLDISWSMEGAKIAEANAAILGLNQELGKPENKNGFYTGCITYGETARVLLAPKPSSMVRPEELTATAVAEETNIAAGLTRALEVLGLPPPEPGNWLRSIAVFMTDGQHNCGDKSEVIAAATALKAKADLICVGFGFAADMDLLRRIATSPQHAFSCASGTDLRRFFANVGKTMSVSMQQGQNAAAVLGGGGVVRG
jgi:uncharacterized protein YegL